MSSVWTLLTQQITPFRVLSIFNNPDIYNSHWIPHIIPKNTRQLSHIPCPSDFIDIVHFQISSPVYMDQPRSAHIIHTPETFPGSAINKDISSASLPDKLFFRNSAVWDSDKMPNHGEMIRTKCQKKLIQTKCQMTTEKSRQNANKSFGILSYHRKSPQLLLAESHYSEQPSPPWAEFLLKIKAGWVLTPDLRKIGSKIRQKGNEKTNF